MLPSFATVCVCNPNAGPKLPDLSDLPFAIKPGVLNLGIMKLARFYIGNGMYELKYNVFR
jgi:hypothetical protein